MRTICRKEAGQTYFLITDMEPAYEEVLQGLLYPQHEDGFGRAFPSDTPNLDQIYLNFERYAQEMLLQAARVHPVPWEHALSAFMQTIEGQNLEWWLTGSAALSVRGIDVEPGDFDLVVDQDGAQRLGELLMDYLYEPVMPVQDWIGRWFGRAFLHARFEWVGDVNESIEQWGVSDAGPTAARSLETITWHGKEIRVPPLDLQLEVNERRGLTERVEKIKRFVYL
jgi:hypothetical protein